MSNIHQFPMAVDKTSLIAGLDSLKAKIESGEMTGYFIVGVGPGDVTCPMWGAAGKGISILRGLGAIEALKHKFLAQIDWNTGSEQP